GRLSADARNLRSATSRRPRRLERLPDRSRQGDQRRGTHRIDSRIYVRRRRARRGEPLAGGRSGDGATDAVFLSRNVDRKPARGGRSARGADRDVEKLALVGALLLGGIHNARGVQVGTERIEDRGSHYRPYGESQSSIFNPRSSILNPRSSIFYLRSSLRSATNFPFTNTPTGCSIPAK